MHCACLSVRGSWSYSSFKSFDCGIILLSTCSEVAKGIVELMGEVVVEITAFDEAVAEASLLGGQQFAFFEGHEA